jgi:protein-glutamine gamma-glutamyltransferase
VSEAERGRLPLRVAVLVAGLAGLLALGTAQLLSQAATVAAVVCLVAASAAPVWLSSIDEAKMRRGASIAVLLIVAGYAAHSALVGLGDDPLVSIGPVLALLLAGLQLAHALVLNTRRDLLVGLTIGLFMTVLAAGLAPGPAVAVPLLVGWPVAVTALVLAQRLEQLEAGHPVARMSAQRAAPGTAAGIASAVVITLLAGLVVFLLLPQPTGLSARSRLLGNDPQLDVTSGEVRGTGYYSGGIMDLRTRGSLSDDPVLDVPLGSPQLWRSTVLSTYDGQSWYGTTDSLTQLTPGPTYAVPHRLDDEVVGGTARTDVVHLLDGFSGSVVAPGVVSSITVQGRLLVDSDGGLIVTGGLSQAPVSTYTVTSTPEVTDPVVLAGAHGADIDPARWLQLPPTLPQRVRDLASQVTSGKAARVDEVRAVETYLRANEKYQLDSPVPPPGADAVDDFLFTSNAGFCEQFASAEVVMLRSVGVPARLVTGLAYGDPAAGGVRRMLVSNTHAWVEVWYPGVGWSPSDPTAGSTLAADSAASLLSTLWHNVYDSAASRALLALAVGAFALFAGWALRWARRVGTGRAGLRAEPASGPLVEAFRRLERALAASGRPRQPSETISELSHRVPPIGSAALETLERACYGPGELSAQEADEAVGGLDDLTRGLAEVTRQ